MSNDFQSYFNTLRQSVEEIAARDLAEVLDKEGKPLILIDVREQSERDSGFIERSKHIARSFLEIRIQSEVADRNCEVVVYCESGTRSLLACNSLQNMGYRRCRSLRGGLQAWKTSGLPISIPDADLDIQYLRKRYSRHLLLPEVGEAGQRKLMNSSVLLIGAGGLGSPIGLYLAAAGIGNIGIVDHDLVDESNLQRQILHSERTVGIAKVDSASTALRNINSKIRIETYREAVSPENAARLIQDYDIVIDGTDNFKARYTVNDACITFRKPLIYGAIFRFEGQVSVFVPGNGPCYRCLFPELPLVANNSSCLEAGVLGVLPGTIGLLMATECVKLLLGIGESLTGRLLLYDALQMKFRDLQLPRDANCVCSTVDRVD